MSSEHAWNDDPDDPRSPGAQAGSERVGPVAEPLSRFEDASCDLGLHLSSGRGIQRARYRRKMNTHGVGDVFQRNGGRFRRAAHRESLNRSIKRLQILWQLSL